MVNSVEKTKMRNKSTRDDSRKKTVIGKQKLAMTTKLKIDGEGESPKAVGLSESLGSGAMSIQKKAWFTSGSNW